MIRATASWRGEDRRLTAERMGPGSRSGKRSRPSRKGAKARPGDVQIPPYSFLPGRGAVSHVNVRDGRAGQGCRPATVFFLTVAIFSKFL